MVSTMTDPIIMGPVRLSTLFTDPRVREAFRRAERNNERAFAIPSVRSPELAGGAAEPLPALGERTGSGDLVRIVGATLFLATVFVAAMLPAVLR
jgi:hypothetical protein